MIYFAIFAYAPNTAPTNRFMAYIKALSELGEKIRVVFFYPDDNRSKVIEQYANIEFVYYWEKFFINIPVFNKLLLWIYIKHFIKSLGPSDVVFVYCFPDLIVALSHSIGIKYFSEITEHPDVSFPAFIHETTKNSFIKACKKSDGNFVISKGLKRYLVDHGCAPDKVHIINMIADTSRFGGLIKQESEPYIAYCGTASNNKDGVDQLIKAFAIVQKRHPDYKLYIIGRMPSNKERFGNLDLVKSLGIENNVVFTGIIPASEMPQTLKNATILALDRPDNQQARFGFPTKLGEYLLTGNPVVITGVGDIPLFLKDKDSAMIADPDNPQMFADKLCWLIEHPDKAVSIGDKGRRIAEENFNSYYESKKLIDIINKA